MNSQALSDIVTDGFFSELLRLAWQGVKSAYSGMPRPPARRPSPCPRRGRRATVGIDVTPDRVRPVRDRQCAVWYLPGGSFVRFTSRTQSQSDLTVPCKLLRRLRKPAIFDQLASEGVGTFWPQASTTGRTAVRSATTPRRVRRSVRSPQRQELRDLPRRFCVCAPCRVPSNEDLAFRSHDGDNLHERGRRVVASSHVSPRAEVRPGLEWGHDCGGARPCVRGLDPTSDEFRTCPMAQCKLTIAASNDGLLPPSNPSPTTSRRHEGSGSGSVNVDLGCCRSYLLDLQVSDRVPIAGFTVHDPAVACGFRDVVCSSDQWFDNGTTTA